MFGPRAFSSESGPVSLAKYLRKLSSDNFTLNRNHEHSTMPHTVMFDEVRSSLGVPNSTDKVSEMSSDYCSKRTNLSRKLGVHFPPGPLYIYVVEIGKGREVEFPSVFTGQARTCGVWGTMNYQLINQ